MMKRTLRAALTATLSVALALGTARPQNQDKPAEFDAG
jgi:hypothetical protein